MAGPIQIDTAKVLAASEKLSSISKSFHKEFAEAEQTLKTMDSTWNGKASDNAITAYKRIKSQSIPAVSNDIDAFAAYLRNIVTTGYEVTEGDNVNLSDSIK